MLYNKIATVQDAESVIETFEFEGSVSFNTDTMSLVFQIIKPKFKWYQFFKKINFSKKYTLFQGFVVKRVILSVSTLFNLVEK